MGCFLSLPRAEVVVVDWDEVVATLGEDLPPPFSPPCNTEQCKQTNKAQCTVVVDMVPDPGAWKLTKIKVYRREILGGLGS
jgi:hypothetical protein